MVAVMLVNLHLCFPAHSHLDHCGALPYFTEMCGYNGPVLMTHPTKSLCPILLEDYRRITVDRRGESNFFTTQMIQDCMNKVTPLNIHESIFLAPDFEVKPYYAGHVLGAAMFYVRVENESVVYTGDYNMTPDRHLGAAWIDSVCPDVLITESTYATTFRESKRARERDFLRKVHQAVAGGGKVLIPVFALGRVQELCILVETYWERMGLGDIPVYFSAGMAATATEYYRLYLGWTNEHIKEKAATQNPFAFRFIRTWEKHFADIAGPMVLFSTPGMLHSGTSLEVFKRWAGDPKNMLIIPGYCVAGTVGAKVLSGATSIDLSDAKGTILEVRLQVRNLSFSAHADAKGILQLIKNVRPKHVILVHGEAAKMALLKDLISRQFGIPCHMPANGQLIAIPTVPSIPLWLDPKILTGRSEEITACASNIYNSTCLGEEKKADLLMEVAKLRAGPKRYTATLRWTLQDIQDARPPQIIPTVSMEGSYTVFYEVTIAIKVLIEVKYLHTILLEALAKEGLPVTCNKETAIFSIRDAVEVWTETVVGSSNTTIVLRWPKEQSPLGQIAIRALLPVLRQRSLLL